MVISNKLRSKYEGKTFKTENYGKVEVLKVVSSDKAEIRFVNTGWMTTCFLSGLRVGKVRDWSAPSVLGVGIVGKPLLKEEQQSRGYSLWKSMLGRCYNEKLRLKYKSYKGCSVSPYFLNYQNFKDWCEQQVGFNQEGWHLDKDILVKGNKIYSEDTCCFVPPELNALLTSTKAKRGSLPIGVHCYKGRGTYASNICKDNHSHYLGSYKTPEEAFLKYKEEREAYIKSKAHKWKDQIDARVYQALMNWKIEITD